MFIPTEYLIGIGVFVFSLLIGILGEKGFKDIVGMLVVFVLPMYIVEKIFIFIVLFVEEFLRINGFIGIILSYIIGFVAFIIITGITIYLGAKFAED